MNVKECYEKMGSDYTAVLGRLRSDVMIQKFALKFLNDTSYQKLEDAMGRNDGQEAFRAVHTLKGVCLNLGFDELCEVSVALTEELRGQEHTEGKEAQFEKVKEKYHLTIEAIKGLE